MAKTAAGGSTPIEALLKERRKFPPPKAFTKAAHANRLSVYTDAAKNPNKFWEGWAKQLRWFKPWKKTLEWKAPYAKWFIGGKLNVSDNCLDRHIDTPAPHQGGDHLGRRARRHAHADLLGPLPRGQPLRRRAQAARRRRRATASRSTCRWCPRRPIAMLACTRIGAPHSVVFGGLRPRGAARPHPRRRVDDPDHRRRRLSPWRHRRAQEERRRGPQRVPGRPHGRRGQAHRPGDRDAGRAATSGGTTSSRTRPRTARPRRWTARTCCTSSTPRARRASPRASCTRPAATSPACQRHPQAGVRHQGHRRLLVHRRHRLGHRPLLRRLRPARQRRHHGDVRGHAGLPRQGPLLADHREVRRSRSCYTAPTAIRTFMRWGEEYPNRCDLSTPAAARDRSASRSIPRRGSGTGRSSAAAAAPWSTRGGRPRPATS